MAPEPEEPARLAAAAPPSALPAVLLEPAWAWRGAVGAGAELGQAFDLPPPAGAPPAGFTLCASVRRPPGQPPASSRILQKGEPPAGWLFAAPSAAGVVRFARASKEQGRQTPPEPEASARSSVDPKAGKKGSTDAGKKGKKDAEPVAPEQPTEAPKDAADIGATRVDDGEWHHVAVVHQAGRLRAFVDGTPDGEVDLEAGPCPSAPLELGPAPGEGAGSGLRDVEAYSEALTDVQIADLASGSRSLPTGVDLVLTPREVQEFWRLQEEEGADADDGHDAGGVHHARRLLAEALGLGGPGCATKELQDQVVVSFYVELLNYARTACMSPRKAAVIAGVMRGVFAAMRLRSTTTKRVGEPSSASEVFLEFKRLLMAHTFAAAEKEEAGRLGVFTLPDVRLLSSMVSGSFFQHFVLYQCVLVCPQESIVHRAEVSLQAPRPPPDLARGKLQASSRRTSKGRGSGTSSKRSSAHAGEQPAGAQSLEADGADQLPDGGPEADGLADRTLPAAADVAPPPEEEGAFIGRRLAEAEAEVDASIESRNEALGAGSK